MEINSTISMATIRMDKTTTISATIQQEQQQKQKKNLVPPILFQQTKTKEKSCSTNLVSTPYIISKEPQLIPKQQEQQRQQ